MLKEEEEEEEGTKNRMVEEGSVVATENDEDIEEEDGSSRRSQLLLLLSEEEALTMAAANKTVEDEEKNGERMKRFWAQQEDEDEDEEDRFYSAYVSYASWRKKFRRWKAKAATSSHLTSQWWRSQWSPGGHRHNVPDAEETAVMKSLRVGAATLLLLLAVLCMAASLVTSSQLPVTLSPFSFLVPQVRHFHPPAV